MIKQFFKSLSRETWDLGFIQNSLESILQGDQLQVKWVKNPYESCWFADPFILDVAETEIHVLAEEFYERIDRGRISLLILDKETYRLKDKKVILELPTHLSFPAIMRKDGEIFIYPENGESGEVNLYKYNPLNNAVVKIKTLATGELEDSVITEFDGKEYLFCTMKPTPNGNVLNVYQKSDDGVYKHKGDYVFDENVARMAGDFFEYNGKKYRPAQECNVQYGHAVTIQEVEHRNGAFSFNEVVRLYSVHPKLTVGMHTFNMYKGYIVTDALGFHNMWIRKILKRIGILH